MTNKRAGDSNDNGNSRFLPYSTSLRVRNDEQENRQQHNKRAFAKKAAVVTKIGYEEILVWLKEKKGL
jgi:hypothetical protein